MVQVRFHFERVVTRAESHTQAGHYLPGDVAAFPADLAAKMVLGGTCACAAFRRIRFVAPCRIEAPSRHAGDYAAGAQLFVMDAATADDLVPRGSAIAA